MKKILHKLKENRGVVDLILILVLAVILSIPNVSKNADIYFDDGSQHLMRAYGAYQAIGRNEDFSVISSFTNGFGYSWDLFYGPLSEYALLILGFIFHSFNTGFKILLFFILFFAGSCMYKFVYQMTDNRNTALLAGVIYLTSPYFFTDIYTRHALGECMVFVFIPMVFLGLYQLFNTEKNHYYLTFGAVGLILSHNISACLTAIFAFIYCMINIKNISRTRVKKGLAINIFFIVVITSFYWGPFLQTKFFTEYRVFEKDAMATQESVIDSALEVKDLLITLDDEAYCFEIGLPVILMLAFSIMAFRALKENRKEYLFFFISGIVSSWMSTKYFPWKILPNGFYIIQFSWRMLLFSSFFFAIVCAMNMTILIKKFNGKDVLVVSLICMLYIFSKYSYVPHAEEVARVEDDILIGISGQENQWIPGMGRMEYLPSKAYQHLFYIATRQTGIACLEGECEIREETKIGSHMKAKIITNEEATLELPYLYYPGYTVKLDGVPVNVFETENGFVGLHIEKDEQGTLEVNYTGTKIMNLTKGISCMGVILYLIYVYQKH